MYPLVEDDVRSAIPPPPGQQPRVGASAMPAQALMDRARARADQIMQQHVADIEAIAAANQPQMPRLMAPPPPPEQLAGMHEAAVGAQEQEEAGDEEDVDTSSMSNDELRAWLDKTIPVEGAGDEDAGWLTRYVGAPAKRGYESVMAMPDQMTGDYEEYAQAQRDIRATTQLTDEDKAVMQEIDKADFWDAVKLYAKNPRLAVATAAESLPMSAAPLVGALAGGAGGSAIGGPIGTVIGAGAGGFTGSFAMDYQAGMQEAMASSGLDVTNPEDIAKFYADPNLYEKLRSSKALHAVPVAVIDTLSLGMAGRLVKMAEKSGLAKKALAHIAEVLGQGAMGAAGEGAGQLAESGKITSGGAMAGELFGEVAMAPAEIATAPFAKGEKPTVKPGEPSPTTPEVDPAVVDAVKANAPPGATPSVPEIVTQANATARERAQQVLDAQQQQAAAQAATAAPGAGGGAAPTAVGGAAATPGAAPAPAPAIQTPPVEQYKRLVGEIDAANRTRARATKELEAATAAGDENAVKVATMRLHVVDNALAGLNERLKNVTVPPVGGAGAPAAPGAAPSAPGAPAAAVGPQGAAADPTGAELDALLAAGAQGGEFGGPVAQSTGDEPPPGTPAPPTTTEAPQDIEAQVEELANPGNPRKAIWIANPTPQQMQDIQNRFRGRVIAVNDHPDPTGQQMGVLFTLSRDVANEYDRLGRGEEARAKILGYVEPKPQVPLDQAVAVERHTPDGAVVHGQVVSPQNVPTAVAQQEAAASPGEAVVAKTPEEAQLERALRGLVDEGYAAATNVKTAKSKKPSKWRKKPAAKPLADWIVEASAALKELAAAGWGAGNEAWGTDVARLGSIARRVGISHANREAKTTGGRGAAGARGRHARVGDMQKTAEELRARVLDVLEGRAAAPVRKAAPAPAPVVAPAAAPAPVVVAAAPVVADAGGAAGSAAPAAVVVAQPAPAPAVAPTKKERAKAVSKERSAPAAPQEPAYTLSYEEGDRRVPRIRKALKLIAQKNGWLEFRTSRGEQLTVVGEIDRLPGVGEVRPGDVLLNGKRVGKRGSHRLSTKGEIGEVRREQRKEDAKKEARAAEVKEKGGEAVKGTTVGDTAKGELELVSNPIQNTFRFVLDMVEPGVLDTAVRDEETGKYVRDMTTVEEEAAAKKRVGELLGDLPDMGLIGALFTRFRRANRADMDEAQAKDVESRRTPEQVKAFEDIVSDSNLLMSNYAPLREGAEERLAKAMNEFPGGAWPEAAQREWLNFYARITPAVQAQREAARAERLAATREEARAAEEAEESNERAAAELAGTGTVADETEMAEAGLMADEEAAAAAESVAEMSELDKLIAEQEAEMAADAEGVERRGDEDVSGFEEDWGVRSAPVTQTSEQRLIWEAVREANSRGRREGTGGAPTIQHLLEALLASKGIPSNLRPLLARLAKLGLQTRFDITHVTPNVAAYSHNLRNSIPLFKDRDYIKFGTNTLGSIVVVAHEIVHAATVTRYAVDKNFARHVDALFNHVKNSVPEADWHQFYGMRTPEEFLSEAFTNINFQYFLDGIATPEHLRTPETSTVWKSLLKAIRKAFGLEGVKNSVLEEVMKLESSFSPIEHAMAMPGAHRLTVEARHDAYNAEMRAFDDRVDAIKPTLTPHDRENYGYRGPPSTPREARARMNSFFDSIREAVNEKTLGYMLYDYLLDYGARLVASTGNGTQVVRDWIKVYRAKQHDARMIQQRADAVMREARKLSMAEGEALAKVANDATLHDISPDKSFADHDHFKGVEAEAQQVYNRVKKAFDALSPQARKVYIAMRNHYKALHETSTRAQLHAVLERGGLSDHLHKAEITRIQLVGALMNAKDKSARQEIVDKAFANVQNAGAANKWTMQHVDEILEETSVKGDYFPLTRHGEYVAEGKRDGEFKIAFDPKDSAEFRKLLVQEVLKGERVKNPGRKYGRVHMMGDEAVVDYEDHALFTGDEKEAAAMLKQLKGEGYYVGKFPTVKQTSTSVETGALRELLAYMSGRRRKASDSTEEREAKADAMDAVRAAHIRLLADSNLRKSELERKRVRGSENDFHNLLKTFAERSYSGAWSLANLKHVVDEQEAIAGLNALHKNSDNPPSVGRFVEELKARRLQDLTMHQNNGSWARFESGLTRFAFVWYLGSLSHALSNATQPWLVSLPIIAGEHGLVRTGRKMARVSGRFTKPAIKRMFVALGDAASGQIVRLDDALDAILTASSATPQVKSMLRELVARGVIDTTMVTELARAAHAGPSKSMVARAVGHTAQYIESIAKVMPQLTEIMNRLVTATAAYELARERGATLADATNYAEKMTRQTQGNYSVENLPRHLRKFTGFKLVALYKTFGMLMYGLTLHTFNRAFFSRTATATEKKAARKAALYFAGINGALLGAVGGLFAEPLRAIAFGAGMALRGMGGDDSEDEDVRKLSLSLRNPDVALRRMFGDWAGDEMGFLMSDGALSAATGVEWGQRVGFGHLLWQPLRPSRDAEEWLGNMAMALAGPVMGLLVKGANAMTAITDGNYQRAGELLMPKGVSDISKGARLMEGGRGIEDTSGVTLLSADDATAGDVARQMIGFTPRRAQEMYDPRGEQLTAKQVIEGKRDNLMDRWARLIEDEDYDAADDLKRGEIADFNRAHPGVETRITNGKLQQRRIYQRKKAREYKQGKYVDLREAQRITQ